MAAVCEFQTDAGVTLSTWNFGNINNGSFTQQKFFVKNTGNLTADAVQVFPSRLVQNDGIDYVTIAQDINGIPGSFTSSPLNVGSLAPNQSYGFWIKITIPNGVLPAGNPRQFQGVLEWSGV